MVSRREAHRTVLCEPDITPSLIQSTAAGPARFRLSTPSAASTLSNPPKKLRTLVGLDKLRAVLPLRFRPGHHPPIDSRRIFPALSALPFQRLVIHGVGLLGGSLGLAVRRQRLAHRVVGLGRSAEKLARARDLGALDEFQTDPAAALAGADAVVLAIPPVQIRESFAQIAPYLERGTFVTDVGSVKARIVEAAEANLPSHARFVGSHPMAGSEKTGAHHARADFYVGYPCLLTPTGRTAPEALALARALWEAVGSRVVELDPARHDRLLAGISHLPHVVAAALIQTLTRHLAPAAELGGLCGQGLRDTTRVAGGDTEIWRQILTENAEEVLACLDQMEDVLHEWRAALREAAGHPRRVATLWDEARRARQGLEATDEA
ncbi:MAG TPA: prephenate dehydrogenase/arogenate dehydrogenase family protein [Candidatus Sumerlaeota bacterium]|nr:prephenate dehydrogenase/arogenate dehydrogenase family protein [Candidatus Sumerlaeota bacterium]HOR28159.1 prephenate dehydrogenase/arogenate dehydrogenase family protein [Candidatus Sumerlaeota bacterium]HPK01728.1 prephenate dehydrogenase/arogenate dehydrogenase family protein [Candidatus Sumerlaeota bacterium]